MKRILNFPRVIYLVDFRDVTFIRKDNRSDGYYN
jgi:hypothetical protein